MKLNQLSSQIIKPAINIHKYTFSLNSPGLLINFYEAMLKDGITRIINAPLGAECLA